MSAYAALISLRRTLVYVVYFQPWISHNRDQLLILLTEVASLLSFLCGSSAHRASQITSALETKMREAAYNAEDLIGYGILDSKSKTTLVGFSKINILYVCYTTAVLVSSFLLLSYMNLETLTARVVIGLELAFCVLNAAFLYRCFREIYDFPPLNDSQELRWVLRDFSIIVSQMKEARGEAAEMSAYEALISLLRILHQIPNSGRRDHLRSLQEKVKFLLEFLGKASPNCNLDSRIRDAVYKAKRALIEFQLPSKLKFSFSTMMNVSLPDLSILLPHALLLIIFRTASNRLRSSKSELTTYGFPFKVTLGWALTDDDFVPSRIIRPLCIAFASYLCSAVAALVVLAAQYNSKAPENQELPHVIDDFSVIVRDVNRIKKPCRNRSNLPSSSTHNLGGARSNCVVVGLDGDLIALKDHLLRDSTKRELASIVGMGGIGKTTLARQVFEDQLIVSHFDVRAWVKVSQEYSFRHVLLCLLDSAEVSLKGKSEDSDDKLALYLYQYLIRRRYLIVIDDVWDTKIWESLSRFLPDDDNGSRVLITSRLPNVASRLASSSPLPHVPLHHMQCLNENDSWYLLRGMVVRDEKGFASELESIGREVAKSCRGLPLAIVVIGGLLCEHVDIEAWRDVAENLKKSRLQDIKNQCWGILGLSYNHLPHHLRPCFLYMGVLPRGYEIPVSRLINLWVAEGFMEQHMYITLEEVAEGYLEDLVNRNLISVCKRSCNDKIRTCSIHDLLRDVCVENSRRENFFLVMDDDGNVNRERVEDSPRRLSIHPDALQVDVKHDCVRSVLCIAGKKSENQSHLYLGYVHLQVLDVLEVRFVEFPHQITKLVRLRYLALYYDGALPPSISKLGDLETIVHHSSSREYPLLPRVIWKMRSLRHLYVKPGCYLSESVGYEFFPTSFFLVNLQTLVGIRNFRWSKDIIERVPNLKKLGISYEVPCSVDWSLHQLGSLADLHQLEALKIIIKYEDAGSATYPDPPELAFPRKLKKLSLSGSRAAWESMTAIGELPYLEALKLRSEAFCGRKWKTAEGGFPRLVFLLLEGMSFTTWESEESHFPRLQRLVLRSCDMLEEIPFSFGDIPTLEMIKLVDCHPSAEASASKIQEEQEWDGNETLKFEIERREEVNGTDKGKMEAGRGVGPGGFQLLSDTLQSGEYDIPLVLVLVVALGVIVVALYFILRVDIIIVHSLSAMNKLMQ